MLEDNLTDNLLENETVLTRFYFLSRFCENPAFELGVCFSINHVYFSKKGVEIGEIVNLL